MKKLISISAVLFITLFTAHAQTRTSIKKAYAFVQVTMPGTIMVDDNGKPIKPPLNITRFLYIETTGTNQPRIESVQYGNETFKVSVGRVSSLRESSGITKENGQPVTINISKSNSLWKLELESTEDKVLSKHPEPYRNIIIKERLRTRYFRFIIPKEIELESPVRG